MFVTADEGPADDELFGGDDGDCCTNRGGLTGAKETGIVTGWIGLAPALGIGGRV